MTQQLMFFTYPTLHNSCVHHKMKKIITGMCALILSPFVVAEQYETTISSKDINVKAITGKSTDKVYKGYIEGQKPHLQDFATYNDFIKAMYLYKKYEEDTIKPKVAITLPLPAEKALEYTLIEDNKDIILWGEERPSEYVILGE
jgi:hypothetical protein